MNFQAIYPKPLPHKYNPTIKRIPLCKAPPRPNNQDARNSGYLKLQYTKQVPTIIDQYKPETPTPTQDQKETNNSD